MTTATRRRPSIWAHRRRVPRAAYPQARASNPRAPAQPHQVRPFGLASGGVCQAIPVTRNAGALLPHRFTLTTAWVAVCSLWHFPASHLGLPLAITPLCEVRTFLEPSAAPVPPWFGEWSAAAQPTHPPHKRTASGGNSANTP